MSILYQQMELMTYQYGTHCG